MRSLYQDRLGTNIGIALKKDYRYSLRWPLGWRDSQAGRLAQSTGEHYASILLLVDQNRPKLPIYYDTGSLLCYVGGGRSLLAILSL